MGDIYLEKCDFDGEDSGEDNGEEGTLFSGFSTTTMKIAKSRGYDMETNVQKTKKEVEDMEDNLESIKIYLQDTTLRITKYKDKELQGMSYKQLRDMRKNLGIPLKGKRTKERLIALIKKARIVVDKAQGKKK